VTLRDQLEEHNRAWQRFHEWEKSEPLAERDAGRIISDLGTILDRMPIEARLHDPDPQKLGVRKMLDLLGRLGASR
jgi:hypothetical protein